MKLTTHSKHTQELPISESDLEDQSSVQPTPPPEDVPRVILPTCRKHTILFIVSWMTLIVAYPSTPLLPATPEIASEFSTTVEIINITNAGVLIAMGLSSFIWSPIAEISGRRIAYNAAILMLLACSVVRGRAVGFFQAGSVTGPAIGLCIGGIIVTFTSWRLIYWVQVAMVGLGLVGSFVFVPDIKQIDKGEEDSDGKKLD
ncbi:uncharacterized protein PAC_06204 [Phialocephala subalpina]|uniref:Major facilitator superfamily (MFS) profile domain-containing protein n=1 Tax=Phialocephala subalpina TaxID=576137 RepID=A0A1L7WU72_9HELO|nr:uncharacterized protein PAC_06204 [Phialocephala subalpina]